MIEPSMDYLWPSYRSNALSEEDPLLSAHADCLALGRTDSERRSTYLELYASHHDQNTIKEMREYLQTGTPLGNDPFRAQIELALWRMMKPAERHGTARVLHETGTAQRRWGYMSCVKSSDTEWH
jgi:putative transposase